MLSGQPGEAGSTVAIVEGYVCSGRPIPVVEGQEEPGSGHRGLMY